jgi:hypothetical protein
MGHAADGPHVDHDTAHRYCRSCGGYDSRAMALRALLRVLAGELNGE